MSALSQGQPSPSFSPSDALAIELQEFAIDRQARGLTAKTLAWYAQSLALFAAYAHREGLETLAALTPAHLRAFLVGLQQAGHNPGGVRNIYGAVKALVNWYAAEHDGWPNPLKRVATPRTPQQLLEPVSLETVKALLATCARRTFTGARDRALMMFLCDSGVRHAELWALNVGDLDMATGAVLVRSGKGRKPRVAVVGAKTRRAILAYLKQRSPLADAAPLWATAQGGRLSYAGLRGVLRRRARRARVPEPSLHAFRRFFALNCLRGGMDVYSLQRLLGHADLSVLRRYLAQTDADLLAAHATGGPVDRLL